MTVTPDYLRKISPQSELACSLFAPKNLPARALRSYRSAARELRDDGETTDDQQLINAADRAIAWWEKMIVRIPRRVRGKATLEEFNWALMSAVRLGMSLERAFILRDYKAPKERKIREASRNQKGKHADRNRRVAKVMREVTKAHPMAMVREHLQLARQELAKKSISLAPETIRKICSKQSKTSGQPRTRAPRSEGPD